MTEKALRWDDSFSIGIGALDYEHKDEHEALLNSYTEHMVHFLNDSDVSAGALIEDSLKHWIVDHILTSDKKMSLMVQEEIPESTERRHRPQSLLHL